MLCVIDISTLNKTYLNLFDMRGESTLNIEYSPDGKKKMTFAWKISGGFRGGVRDVRPPPLKFAKHMLYNVN